MVELLYILIVIVAIRIYTYIKTHRISHQNKVSFTVCKLKIKKVLSKQQYQDFPGSTVVKNPPANAGDTGLIPGLGRSHMPRNN